MNRNLSHPDPDLDLITDLLVMDQQTKTAMKEETWKHLFREVIYKAPGWNDVFMTALPVIRNA